MERRFDICTSFDSETRDKFNKYCREKGFTVNTVLKYITENEEIITEILDNLSSEDIELTKDYFNKHSTVPKAQFRYRSNSSKTIKQVLSEHSTKLKLNEFFCYLVINRNIVDDICDSIPYELKMKKYK